jgi:hypothetical protein
MGLRINGIGGVTTLRELLAEQASRRAEQVAPERDATARVQVQRDQQAARIQQDQQPQPIPRATARQAAIEAAVRGPRPPAEAGDAAAPAQPAQTTPNPVAATETRTTDYEQLAATERAIQGDLTSLGQSIAAPAQAVAAVAQQAVPPRLLTAEESENT